jgi:hypothetical protein
MNLNWLHHGIVVDGSTLAPPKDLILRGADLAKRPDKFEVFQVYSPAALALRGLLRQPERLSIANLGVRKGKADKSYEAGWRLPTPRGFHLATQFLFTADDPIQMSGRIRSHRLGTFELGVEPGVSFQDPTHSVPIGTNWRGRIKAIFRAAVDPWVVVGAATEKDLLLAAFNEAFQENPYIQEMEEYADKLWDYVSHASLTEYGFPYDWSLTVRPDEFVAEEGSQTALELAIQAPSPGSGLFAFVASDRDSLLGSEVSDILQIHVDQDGRLAAKLASAFGGSEKMTD